MRRRRAGARRAGPVWTALLALPALLVLGPAGCRSLPAPAGPDVDLVRGPQRPPAVLLELPLPGERCGSPMSRRSRQRLAWAADCRA